MAQSKTSSTRSQKLLELLFVFIALAMTVFLLGRIAGNGWLQQQLAKLGVPIGPVMESIGGLLSWSGWPPLLIMALAVVVLALGLRAFAHHVHKVREAQRKRLAAALSRVMPADWDPEEHLWVRRWHRLFTPRKARVLLTPECRDSNPEWRMAVTSALREPMGKLKPIAWPQPEKENRRIRHAGLRRIWVEADLTRRIRDGEGEASENDADKITEVLSGALSGLVPKPVPDVTVTPEGKRIINIGYSETTRDQSMVWRGRVVDQVQARLGDDRLRDSWDRKERNVTLTQVPELPKLLQWVEQQAELRKTAPAFARWAVPYGTDENNRVVFWEPGDVEPHGLIVGETGSGKSELMKTIAAGWLMLGGLVMIADWKKGWSEFLGKPGVITVATEDGDRVGLLEDIRTEVQRRLDANDMKKIISSNPELGIELPDELAYDDIPILFILDELTLHQKGVQSWWSSLTKEDKEKWGSIAKNAPMLTWPAELVMVTRAVKIFGLFGMQRPDAANFGDSTAMRENLAHMVSMGRLKPIGSEMMWDNRQIGVQVEISGQGEGLSNGYRLGVDGRSTVPGRFKAWYLDGILDTPEFWAEVAKAAPAPDLMKLDHVSPSAIDPRAAVEALYEKAYGGRSDLPPLRGHTTSSDLPAGVELWGQLTYGCGRDGWQVLESPGLSDAEAVGLRSQVSTHFDLQNSGLSRVAYGPVDGVEGAVAWWHGSPAGADPSGRPGNVFTHVLLNRSGASDGVLPIDYAYGEGWLTPVGAEEVEAATLGDIPVPVSDAQRVVDFVTGDPSRVNRLTILVDACVAAVDGGRPVGMALDDMDNAVDWIAAVSWFLPADQVARFYWSTLERADLSFSPRRFHLVCMPADEAHQVRDLAWIAESGPVGSVPERLAKEAEAVPSVFANPDFAATELNADTGGEGRRRRTPPPIERSAEVPVTPDVIVRNVVDQPDEVEIDDNGAVWEEVAISEVAADQLVRISDMPGGKVVDVPGWCTDEFDGSEVFRVLIDTGRGEEVLDLNGEEVVTRQADPQAT